MQVVPLDLDVVSLCLMPYYRHLWSNHTRALISFAIRCRFRFSDSPGRHPIGNNPASIWEYIDVWFPTLIGNLV